MTAALAQRLDRGLRDLLPPSVRVAKRAIQSWRRGEPELHLLPRLCSRDRWSVDVGANTGVYSWHMARWSAGVTAFEPQPALARMLERAFGGRVAVERVALSDTPGEAVLRVPVDRHQDGRATIEPQNDLARLTVRELVVPRRRLDSYRLPPVGLIKIDVEGHELAVLSGASGILRRDRPSLIIEAEDRHRPGAFDSIRDYLRGFGYRPHVCRGGGLVPVEAWGVGAMAGVNFVFLAEGRDGAGG